MWLSRHNSTRWSERIVLGFYLKIRARLIVTRPSKTSLLSRPDISPSIIVPLKRCSPWEYLIVRVVCTTTCQYLFFQRSISFVHWLKIWPMSRNAHQVSPLSGGFENIPRGVVPTCLSHGWTLWAASQQQVSRSLFYQCGLVCSIRVEVPHKKWLQLDCVQ